MGHSILFISYLNPIQILFISYSNPIQILFISYSFPILSHSVLFKILECMGFLVVIQWFLASLVYYSTNYIENPSF